MYFLDLLVFGWYAYYLVLNGTFLYSCSKQCRREVPRKTYTKMPFENIWTLGGSISFIGKKFLWNHSCETFCFQKLAVSRLLFYCSVYLENFFSSSHFPCISSRLHKPFSPTYKFFSQTAAKKENSPKLSKKLPSSLTQKLESSLVQPRVICRRSWMKGGCVLNISKITGQLMYVVV